MSLRQQFLAALVSLNPHIGMASALPEDKAGSDEDRRHGNGRYGREPILCRQLGSSFLLFGAGESFVSAKCILAAEHPDRCPPGSADYEDLVYTHFSHALQGRVQRIVRMDIRDFQRIGNCGARGVQRQHGVLDASAVPADERVTAS